MLYEKLLRRQTPLYVSPEDFLAAVVEYFKWAEDNPLQEESIFQYKGVIVRADSNKMRPFTKQGLASYLGIPVSRLESYRNRGDAWADAVDLVDQVMFEQKFSGAAAGLMNAAIITRELGIAEKQEITGRDGEPLQTVVQYQLPSNGRD